MGLAAGTRIGVYDIGALIGAGGMGEVYRARDTRLERDVAIKVLPASFAHAPDRLARFQREAKTLAALNHTNIATIHGFEESNGVQALVMELVEGANLADRIAERVMTMDEALAIARQIAEALEAAHENGVIHRDLKPANVKITADDKVKVLDFGLAKMIEPASQPSPGVSQSPTITTPAMMSGVGVILGTAAYMSPEQAKGKPADKRSDMWAFGCVLFEMLGRRRAFQGDDVGDVLAAVLRAEPDWSALPAETPAPIRRLLRRCLEKDRRRRLESAADARLEIEDALAAPALESSKAGASRHVMPLWSAVLVGIGALAATVVMWTATLGRAPAPRPVTRLSVNLEPGIHLGEAPRELLLQQRPVLAALAFSPDGRRLVYVGHDGKTSRLFVRLLDQDHAVPIAGTTGAQSSFFSPDGREIGFFVRDPNTETRDAQGTVIGTMLDARGAIRRVAADGGPVRTIEISGQSPRVFPSATWAADDTILLAGTDGIYRLAAGGGTVERLVPPALGQSLRFPELLPGARAILFNINSTNLSAPSLSDIATETLDTHRRTIAVYGGSHPHFAASGHVVFARGGRLMAVRYDEATGTTRGDPVIVVEDVMQSDEGRAYFRNNGSSQFAVSRSGDLAYVPGGVYAQTNDVLMWVDRRGAAEALPLPPAPIFGVAISPDGKRIAWAQGAGRQFAIWLFDVEHSVTRRLTEAGRYSSPIWSPDGTRLAAVVSGDAGAQALAIIDVDRGGDPQRLRLEGVGGYGAAAWPSSNTILLQRITASMPGQLASFALDGAAQLKPMFDWSSPMQFPVFSRDGRWMSYSVNETGAFEVYVRPLPAGAPVVRVSTNGGTSSAWSPDGRELFYREGDRIMAVPISTEGGFRQLAAPRVIFSGNYIEASVPSRGFEIAPNGRRFLMKARGREVESSPVTSIQVVLNWFEELKRLVPAK